MVQEVRFRGAPKNDTDAPEIFDPQNAPIVFVDTVLAVSPGPVSNLVLGTWHQEPLPGGGVETQHVIAARLRFDIRFARQLRDTLDAMIAAAEQ
ncbi:hypothetical protein ILT44_21345 [Microvirga sp. BT689]|uniref:hypothetical protein n=1 Tax=Microvirga arvi TaxID=2778731 RepID=UPI00194E88D2|nr:hypothetical protein [Microvirga arvi]MBM6582755.1 hypothetical protein [Microvirga arvi]